MVGHSNRPNLSALDSLVARLLNPVLSLMCVSCAQQHTTGLYIRLAIAGIVVLLRSRSPGETSDKAGFWCFCQRNQ